MSRAFWAELEARKPQAHMALGLARIRQALDGLGAPDRDVNVLLVAGTNGKGSTVRFAEHLLTRQGKRVGAFTSPHIWHPTERIRLAGVEIDEPTLINYLQPLAEGFDELTYFELFAVAAIQYFRDRAVDAAVLEVGLGGRLDATNACRRVVAAAIASIDLDHTHILGESIAEIAAEKAAIARSGVGLWHNPLAPEAARVVRAHAAEVGAPCHEVAAGAPPAGYTGPHALWQNCRLAAELAGAATGRPAEPTADDLAERPFGRWTVVDPETPKVIDGAHNAQAVAAVAPAIPRSFPTPPRLWLAVGRTKDAAAIVQGLLDRVGGITLIDHGDPARWHTPAELRALIPDDRSVEAVAADRAARAFADSAEPSLWLGSLRGLELFPAATAGAPR